MCKNQEFITQPRTRILVWACVWIWVCMIVGVRGGCPKMCVCYYRDSKETAACREADFIDIPRGLDATTQVLDLSHNNLKILPRDAFVYTGLTKLQKVVLSHCKLFLLEAGSFNSVENVMEMDLSNNLLKHVPSASLKGLVMLRELNLANNAITTLSSSAFSHTLHIVQLDLSHNGLTRVMFGALRNLTELEVLNVAENKLSYFNASELETLPLLRVIRLDGNPWRCNCHLRPLRQWFHDRNLAASVPPSCSYPKWLMGRDWQLVAREDLLCAPQVAAVAPRVLAAHGENVSLLCRIETEVETSITWLIGDVPLFNDSDMNRYLVVDLVTANNLSFISNLTITDVVTEDQGTYRCVAENRAGVRETNFTLQVSHEVAEVRVATVTVSYMKEGLLGGMSALIIILVLTCSVVYCKVRSREPRRDEDSVDTAQSSRGSECEAQHKLAGYHVVPTNDLDNSPHRQQPDATWNIREGGPNQELSSEASAMPTVPFLDTTKDACPIREPTQVVVRHTEAFPHRVCSRSVSQVSLTNASHYPDLLDLPPAPLQHLVTLQDTNQGMHGLSAAACVRKRTYSDAGCLAGAGGGNVVARTEVNHDLQPLTTHNHDNQDSSRSSSALNLALSQAASNAYANAHLAAVTGTGPPHQCIGAASMLDNQGESRSDGVSEGDGTGGNVCSQHLHPADPCHFEYHAAQLEKFLKEYRCLQEQLNHMKLSYEAHKRAGSMPRLDCCPQGAGGHRQPSNGPNGIPDPASCCSCTPNSRQQLPQNFTTETSLTETPVNPYTDTTIPISTSLYPDTNQTTQASGVIEPRIEVPTSQAYTEGYIPYQYIEPNKVPNQYIDGSNVPNQFLDGSKVPNQYIDGSNQANQVSNQMYPEASGDPRVGSPGGASRSSPKGRSSSKNSKEPLKSILKKNTEGATVVGGRRRGNQWGRSASCCDTRPTPAHDTSYPGSDMYPVASDPSYQPTDNLQTTSDSQPLQKLVDVRVQSPSITHHFES